MGAATEEDGFMPLVNAVLKGDCGKLDIELKRMREHGMNAVGVLLAVERRAAQLAQITAQLGPRGSLDGMDRGAKARLGIFWRDERDIRDQLQSWHRRKLERLGPKLMQLHKDLLGNSQPSNLHLDHGKFRFANDLNLLANRLTIP